jgi:hypothetical protein
MTEQERMQVSPGAILPNGWVCLMETHFGDAQQDGVVLAHHSQNAHPFATWQVVWTQSEGRWFPRTIHGDYCLTFDEAVRSYDQRCEQVGAFVAATTGR